MNFVNSGQKFAVSRFNGDKDAFKLILLNLFKNAMQHTFRGVIKVVVCYDEENQMLHTAVMDTGTGMTKA